MTYRQHLTILGLLLAANVFSQALPADGPLTLRPALQQLGERLLQHKTGSIVAINPANGEILCLATNTPQGSDVRQAIGKPNAPGSTFKTAQALTLLSEGIVTPPPPSSATMASPTAISRWAVISTVHPSHSKKPSHSRATRGSS